MDARAACQILPDADLLLPFGVAELENLGPLGARVPGVGFKLTTLQLAAASCSMEYQRNQRSRCERRGRIGASVAHNSARNSVKF